MVSKTLERINKVNPFKKEPSRFSALASDKAVEVMEHCDFYQNHTREECAVEYQRLHTFFIHEYERGRMRPD